MMYNMLGFETKNVHPQVDALSTYTIQVIQQEAKSQEVKPRGGSATYDKDNCFNFYKQTVTIVPNTGPSALFGDEINLYS